MSSERKIIEFLVLESNTEYWCDNNYFKLPNGKNVSITPAKHISILTADKLKLGYEPYGPIKVAMFGNTYLLLQTVVKYETTQNVNSDVPPTYNEITHKS